MTSVTSERERDAARDDTAQAPMTGRAARFRPPSRRTFVAMIGAAAASLALRDRLTGREVLRNPVTGKPIWIGHV